MKVRAKPEVHDHVFDEYDNQCLEPKKVYEVIGLSSKYFHLVTTLRVVMQCGRSASRHHEARSGGQTSVCLPTLAFAWLLQPNFGALTSPIRVRLPKRYTLNEFDQINSVLQFLPSGRTWFSQPGRVGVPS